MLSQITSLTRNGLKDWYLQRFSAIVLVLYAIFVVGFIWSHSPISFETWYAFFQHPLCQYFTIFALLALIIHAWVGMWTVFTDYVSNKLLRLTLVSLMMLAFIVYFVWAIQILWF